MNILNYSHPLTDDHIKQIEAITGVPVESVQEVRVQFDTSEDFASQTAKLIDEAGISSGDWQTRAWLIVLPSLNYIAAVLLAELHGRIGNFPSILRMRPVENAFTTQYEVAEIIKLEAVRQDSRKKR